MARALPVAAAVALALCGGGRAAAAQALDLTAAINHALSRNRELLRTASDAAGVALGIEHARADFQLDVAPIASVGADSGGQAHEYGLRASRKLPWGTELVVAGSESRSELQRGGTVTLELQQPLFRNFGRLVHEDPLVRAGIESRTAARRYAAQRADLVLEVARAYEEILRLRAQVRSDAESFGRMDSLHRLTRAKEGLGRTTRVDTLRAELLRGEALSRLEAGKERLSATEKAFAELLGFPPDAVFELAPTPPPELVLPEAGEAVKTALGLRLDYAQALEDERAAGRQASIAERGLLPDIRLVARRQWHEGLQAVAGVTDPRSTWFVGLSGTTSFNLTREATNARQARIRTESRQQAAEITALLVARQVQQELHACRRAIAKARIDEANLELASARARLARQLLELGRGDTFSVTDAEQAYLQARGEMLASRAEATVSGYRLRHVLGTLVEPPPHLRPGAADRSVPR